MKEGFYSENARAMRPSAIRAMSKLIQKPGIISFAPGQPSPETFPTAEMAEIAREVLSASRDSLQYTTTRGFPPLIDEVAGLMKDRGIPRGPEEILTTSGSQQGLDLVARILVDPGDVVLFELPSYIGAIAAFQNYRAALRGVRQDEDGVDLDHLESVIRRVRAEGRNLKAFYLIPNFQNPSGVTLAPERREAVLRLAEEYDFLLIEDDPYGEIYFEVDRARLLSLAARDRLGRVVYLATLSKLLAPALRTAWIAGDPDLLRRIEIAKEAADLCSSGLDQRLVSRYLSTRDFKAHCERLRSFYRSRRDAMLSALKEHMPSGVTWTRPGGGLFSWVKLPGGADASVLLEPAVAAGVAYVIGQPFHVDGTGRDTLRLAYGKEDEARLREGIKALADVVRESLRR